MSRYLSKKIRQFVAQRAGSRYEHCRLHQEDSFLPFELEHVISLKHGGGNEADNLALACPHCNQHKGTDLTTFIGAYNEIEMLFNPRLYQWEDRFYVENGEIIAKTRMGEATVKLLRFNDAERLIHRQLLMEDGRYP